MQRRTFLGWRISRIDTPDERSPQPLPPTRQHYRASAQERHRTPPRPTADTHAGTTLQGRDPHHTIPACQRGNNRLHSRGRGCRTVNHPIATSPPMLPHGISRAHKGGRQTSTCHDTITRAPYPPFVKDPVGGHRFHMGHIRAPPTTTSFLRHNRTLESLELTQIRVRG